MCRRRGTGRREEPKIIVEPVNPGDTFSSIIRCDYKLLTSSTATAASPPPPPPPAAVVVEPVNAGDDTDDYIPAEEIVIPDVPEERAGRRGKTRACFWFGR
jgi:hypothetical protein